MNIKFSKFILLFLIFIFSNNLIFSSDQKDWVIEEQKAKKLFDDNKYDEAIILFREIILSSEQPNLKREAYFWIAKAYMNSNKLKQAEINLEYYLANYKDEGLNYQEAVYQKGRLLFLQELYQQSIEELNIFIQKYPEHELVSNAYYWIGECLYALGQFDDSALIFNIVINKYQNSIKREASTYKLRLIEHKKSELALQNLLKWSQEQYISTMNQFKIKEKTLQQAINDYEKDQGKSIVPDNNVDYQKLKSDYEDLKQKYSTLENQLKELEKDKTTKDLSDKIKQLKLREDLLNQKEEILKLLEKELSQKEKKLEK